MLSNEALRDPSAEEKRALLELIAERDKRLDRTGFYHLFPEHDTVWEGRRTALFERGDPIYARRRYPKTMEFFEACGKYREVGVMAGNRTGKTVQAGYLITVLATGLYPDWWQPEWKRFPGPIDAWVVGTTNETTRDILQEKLLGPVTMSANGRKVLAGTGIVPADIIVNPPLWKAGVVNLVDTVGIRHTSGGISYISMKSYQQGRESFEGTERSLIWLDEEPPRDIFGECVLRTMTVKGGLIILTFTPLHGLSDTAIAFMPKAA